MEWLTDYHLGGIVIGICTFLIIGLFHPIVVKAEYYWGTRCWWIFLILGIAGIIGSILINDILISSLIIFIRKKGTISAPFSLFRHFGL